MSGCLDEGRVRSLSSTSVREGIRNLGTEHHRGGIWSALWPAGQYLCAPRLQCVWPKGATGAAHGGGLWPACAHPFGSLLWDALPPLRTAPGRSGRAYADTRHQESVSPKDAVADRDGQDCVDPDKSLPNPVTAELNKRTARARCRAACCRLNE
jgi:hypothetical protein